MNDPSHLAALVAIGLLLSALGAGNAAQNLALDRLRPHPRLYADGERIERIRQLIASDPVAREWHADLRQRATAVLDEPPVEYRLIGPRLLHVSRAALDRIATLALLWRLDGYRAFAERATRELMAICGFADWHPAHFLDTAEMTHAAAIGYDWLFEALTVEQREAVKEAIVEKGLKPALDAYEHGGWWPKSKHNWNQVCNGGIAIGALAVGDEEPSLAATILTHARESLPLALDQYEPDGGWAEGPGYWHYATRYTVYLLAALESALGTDLGLSDRPGLAAAGDFRIQATGPLEKTFNYADAGERAGRAAEMLWLARRYGKPLYARHECERPGRPEAWHLLWYEPCEEAPRGLPLDQAFRGIEVAFFRSAWDDPDAVFVGFKGGDNAANHSHLDLGTFVLDALGQRWAVDLGGDDYNLPGYFGDKRWTYYRLRTEGHNTLTLDGANQEAKARAPIIAWRSTPERAFAVADLSAAYPKASRVRRGVALLDRRQVLVQDEVEGAEGVEIAWAMHTRAEVTVEGVSAVLTQGGRSLTARILAPEGARFEVGPADPGPPQAGNEGVRRLVIRLPGARGNARVAVLLSPQGEAAAPAVTPLDEWPAGARP